MSKAVDTRLLQVAAEIAHEWHSDNEETRKWIRTDFAKFAKPFWLEKYGESGYVHMIQKYVDNDEQSIVEYLYNLDHYNKEIVVKYLLSKVSGWSEESRTVVIEED